MKPTINKNSGFTLVELVVAVAILGIVVAIALPTISNLKRNNETKKYTSYENSIISSSKLYMDSYDEDKFNKKDLTTQCAGITFDDLKSHNLLKEYNLDGVKCSGTGDDIAAYVIKEPSGRYKYYPTIICQKDEEKIYETKYTLPSVCTKVAQPIASLDDDNSCFTSSENAKIKINIKDSDARNVQYALVEASSSNNQDAIRNLAYNDITDGYIDLRTVNQGRENKNYKVVLRYGYTGDYEYQYKVLSKTVQLNYKAPKITVVAKKYNGKYNNTDAKEYENYSFDDWTNMSVYVKATAKDSCNKKLKVDSVLLSTNESKKGESVTYNIEDDGEHILRLTTENDTHNDVKIKVDKTAPECSVQVTGNTRNGWYVDKEVGVTLTKSDSLSGVAKYGLKPQKRTTDSTKYNSVASTTVKDDDKNIQYFGYVEDNAGNTAECNSAKFNKDSTPPSVPVVKLKKWNSNEEQSRPTSSTYSNMSLKDYSSGAWSNLKIYTMPYSTDNVSRGIKYYFTTTGTTKNLTNHEQNYRNIESEGTSMIQYKACDAAGNCSEYSPNYAIKIDKIPPTVEIQAVNNATNESIKNDKFSGTKNNDFYLFDVSDVAGISSNSSNTDINKIKWYKQVNYSTTIADAGSGIAETFREWNGYNIKPTANTDAKDKRYSNQQERAVKNGEKSIAESFSLAATGYRQCWYTITDKAGNKTQVKMVTANDNEKPTAPTASVQIKNSAVMAQLKSYNNAGTGWANQDIIWANFESTDTYSGIERYYYKVGATGSWSWFDPTKSYNYDKNTVLYMKTRDNAGNESDVSGPYTFKIDKTPPTCNVTIEGTKGNNNWYTGNVTLKGTCSDGGSGCKGNVSKTVNSDTNSEISPGTVYDNAGNKTNCKTQTVKMDKTPPSCSITIDGTKGWNNWYTSSNVTLTLNKSDAASGIAQYGIIARSTATYNSMTQRTYDSDTTGITYYGYVKDNAGNTNSCNVWFKKDSTAPTAAETISPYYINGDRYWFGYKFTDTISGISNQGHYFKYAYSTPNDASDKKFKATGCGTTYRLNGYKLDNAEYGFTQANSNTEGKFLAGLSKGCFESEWINGVKAQFHICDNAGNCTTTGVVTYYK